MVERTTELHKRLAHSARAGFSLIEIMIAIMIGGVIVAGATYFGYTMLQGAKRTSTASTLQAVDLAIMNYKSEKGEYPKSIKELIDAGFLKKPEPMDAWNHKFVYRITPDGKNPYELYSYGPEGKGGNKASRITLQGK